MTIRLLFLTCGLLLASSVKGQDTVWVKRKYVDAGSFWVGCGFGGQVIRQVNAATGQVLSASFLQFNPRAGFFPTPWLSIGADGIIGRLRGDRLQAEDQYGMGGIIRVYPFYKVQDRLLKQEEMQFLGIPFGQRLRGRDRGFLAQNLFPFVEAGVGWSSLKLQRQGSPIFLASMSETEIKLAIGSDFRIWKGLSAEIAIAQFYYPENVDVRWGRPGFRVGVEWFFPTRPWDMEP